MRDALNKTGRKIWYAIHAGNCEDWSQPVNCVNGSVANMWRTGGDLSSSSFDMWTNRTYRKLCVLGQQPPVRLYTCIAAGLDLATLPAQRALAGPGSFPNPDFLEVGYSPRSQKGRTQSLVEQRSMFTMWAALPGPLILSADLRTSSMNSGRGLDQDVLKILTNEVRAARCAARLAYHSNFARYAIIPNTRPPALALLLFEVCIRCRCRK